MADSKKTQLTIEIDKETYEHLEKCLARAISGGQLPEATPIEQFVVLVVRNYVKSAVALENIGDDFVSELRDKLETFFNPGEIGTEDFYRKMLDSFKNFFEPQDKNKQEPEKKPSEAPPADKKKS